MFFFFINFKKKKGIVLLTEEFKEVLLTVVVKLALTEAIELLESAESSECYLLAAINGLELYA